MKKRFALFLLLSFCGGALRSFAEDGNSQSSDTLCKAVAASAHNSPASAAYVPGVDVHGKPVAPADVSGTSISIPQTIRIPMTVDMAQRMNLPLPAGTELKSEIGMIEVRTNGAVTFNGKDIGHAASSLCAGNSAKKVEEGKSNHDSASAKNR